MSNQKKKSKICANYKTFDSGLAGSFIVKTTGVSCKECIYFSPKNCGADLGKSIYMEQAIL